MVDSLASVVGRLDSAAQRVSQMFQRSIGPGERGLDELKDRPFIDPTVGELFF